MGVGRAVRLGVMTWLCLVAFAHAETVESRPRLAMVLEGSAGDFVERLRKQLDETRRFDWVERPALLQSLKGSRIDFDVPLSLKDCAKIAGVGKTDLLLVCRASPNTGSVSVRARLYDLRSGEFSRELSLLGEVSGQATLADQLALFVRQALPLRCLIKGLEEDTILLDLGESDGIKTDSRFTVYRHMTNIAPQRIGTLRVVGVTPFAARAEAEEVIKGFRLQVGDALIEQTASMLSR